MTEMHSKWVGSCRNTVAGWLGKIILFFRREFLVFSGLFWMGLAGRGVRFWVLWVETRGFFGLLPPLSKKSCSIPILFFSPKSLVESEKEIFLFFSLSLTRKEKREKKATFTFPPSLPPSNGGRRWEIIASRKIRKKEGGGEEEKEKGKNKTVVAESDSQETKNKIYFPKGILYFWEECILGEKKYYMGTPQFISDPDSLWLPAFFPPTYFLPGIGTLQGRCIFPIFPYFQAVSHIYLG